MSAWEQQRVEWLDPRLWDRLERLESRHQRIQFEHEEARRGLERLSSRGSDELPQVWRRYCEAIAELDRTVAEFQALRSGAE